MTNPGEGWHEGRISIFPTAGRAISAAVDTPVLGVAEAAPALPFADFVPVEPPIAFEVAPAPPAEAGVLGAPEAAPEVALLDYQPDRGERGSYLLLHEIVTDEGVIYDVSLPLPEQPAPEAGVLGSAGPPPLRFPVRQVLPSPPARGESGVLGGIGESIAEAAGGFVVRQVLHLLRAPFAPHVRQLVRHAEGPAVTYLVTPDGALGRPLPDFNAWRAAVPTVRPLRALLFVHGFLSNAEASLPRAWMRALAPQYDVALAYSHPTIASSPIHNAADLLLQLPDDVQLEVDVVAHSRGGLVSRSLVELLPPFAPLRVRRVLTCGTPHAGTLLGQFQRWDRLASIALTAASWVLTATGVAAPLAFVPQLLEHLLRAGGQLFFDLPGVNALDPDSRFITRLNAPSASRGIPYAVVVSDFDPQSIGLRSFREALSEMIVNAFIGAPNDLIVHTPSMSSVDVADRERLARWTYRTSVDHFRYFDHEPVFDFARRFLAS